MHDELCCMYILWQNYLLDMVITSAVPRILISDSRQCQCRPECTLNASLDLIVKTTSTDGFRTHVDTFLNKHRCNLLLLTLESLREETLRKSFFLSLIIESYLFFLSVYFIRKSSLILICQQQQKSHQLNVRCEQLH